MDGRIKDLETLETRKRKGHIVEDLYGLFFLLFVIAITAFLLYTPTSNKALDHMIELPLDFAAHLQAGGTQLPSPQDAEISDDFYLTTIYTTGCMIFCFACCSAAVRQRWTSYFVMQAAFLLPAFLFGVGGTAHAVLYSSISAVVAAVSALVGLRWKTFGGVVLLALLIHLSNGFYKDWRHSNTENPVVSARTSDLPGLTRMFGDEPISTGHAYALLQLEYIKGNRVRLEELLPIVKDGTFNKDPFTDIRVNAIEAYIVATENPEATIARQTSIAHIIEIVFYIALGIMLAIMVTVGRLDLNLRRVHKAKAKFDTERVIA